MTTPVNPPPNDPPRTDEPAHVGERDETVIVAAPAELLAPTFGPPLETGDVGSLGPYRLIKELGHGGMGAVYAALDTRLDRRLALKLMLPKFAAEAAAKERFVREARAAARIKHDNVVTVYEADERAGVPYIAMEFLEGYPLDEYLKKKGSPPLLQILRIAAETAAGLAAAHQLGLVHRDIKPANLWLEAPSGRVKVLDFGLAKPVDTEIELTKSGAVVGTPAYMSPEQARGEKVDHRSDLFSLGGVLYRLCTGQLPFRGPTTMAVLMALGTEEPPAVRALNPDIPPPLADLIHQLLAKKSSDRPANAEAVVQRLRTIAHDLSTPLATAVGPPAAISAPIQVTLLPEANPFADIELASSATAQAVSSHKPKPDRRTPWLLAGIAVLFVAVVGGVVLVIKNNGRDPKPDALDDKTATRPDKNDKPNPPISPQPKPLLDTERKIAEHVLVLGGTVQVTGGGIQLKAVADLPKQALTLSVVELQGTKVTNAGLAPLKDCKNLLALGLAKTPITDAGLAAFKGCTSLTLLNLSETTVTDVGFGSFKDCKNLAHVYLRDTGVTDAALVQLQHCKGLTYLGVQKTKMTAKALADFHTGVPGCQIEYDGGVIEPVETSPAKQAELVRWLFDNKKVQKGIIVEQNGQTITINEARQIPAGSFRVKSASFHPTFAGGQLLAEDIPKLAAFVDLESLFLDRTPVTDAGLRSLLPLKNLRRLSLLFTRFSPGAAKTLCEFPNLEHLESPGGDEWLKNLAAAPVLRSLRFYTIDLSAVGVGTFKDYPHLTTLDLHGVKLAEGSFTTLTELKALRLLKLIDMQTLDEARQLAGAMPWCEVHHVARGEKNPTIFNEGRANPDRIAAEWVLQQGGKVQVNGTRTDVAASADLPQGTFQLTVVNLTGIGTLGASGWGNFSGCKHLTQLQLHSAAVSNEGLAHFKDCKDLVLLVVGATALNDAGLAHFKDCKNLKELTISNTQITDASLPLLEGLTKLTKLNLRRTKVSKEAIARLQETLPNCRIDHDTSEPKK